jgi:hypothetical protein
VQSEKAEPFEWTSQPEVVHHERYEREEEKDGQCVWRGERETEKERDTPSVLPILKKYEL